MGTGGQKSSFRKQYHHGKRLPHRTGFSTPRRRWPIRSKGLGPFSTFQATAERGQVQTERHRAQGYSNVAVLAMLEVAKMNAAKGEDRRFLRQRRAGMIAIAAAMPVALLLWLGIAYSMPPLAGMDTLADRML